MKALERKLRLAEFLRKVVEEKSTAVEDELIELRRIRQEQSEAAQAAIGQLDTFRKARTEAEAELAKIREALHRSELQEAESTLKLEAAIDGLRRDHDCEPGVAVSTDCPELEGVTPKARVRELERELKIMGPVNPLALEEFEAKRAKKIVMLLPSRTCTRWFHLLYGRDNVEIRFFKGRLKYGDGTKSSPFPSILKSTAAPLSLNVWAASALKLLGVVKLKVPAPLVVSICPSEPSDTFSWSIPI